MSHPRRRSTRVADEVWAWQSRAACAGSSLFFEPDVTPAPPARGLTSRRGQREAKAKAVCGGCPVRAECAAHAFMTREPYGIWGGFTEGERVRLMRAGWEDLADRRRTRVDIGRLQDRLSRKADAASSRKPSPDGGDLTRRITHATRGRLR